MLFAQSLQINLSGGVPFKDGLRRSCQVTVNTYAGRRLEEMFARVSQGESLSQAAAECGLFRARFAALLAMGEKGGDLAPPLEEITASAVDGMERIMNWIFALTIPAVVILLGAIVATLSISFFGMLLSLLSALSGG